MGGGGGGCNGGGYAVSDIALFKENRWEPPFPISSIRRECLAQWPSSPTPLLSHGWPFSTTTIAWPPDIIMWAPHLFIFPFPLVIKCITLRASAGPCGQHYKCYAAGLFNDRRTGTLQQSGPRTGTLQQSGPRTGTLQQSGPRTGTLQQSGPRTGTLQQSGPRTGTLTVGVVLGLVHCSRVVLGLVHCSRVDLGLVHLQ